MEKTDPRRIFIEGPLSTTSKLFEIKIERGQVVHIDLGKVTFINSVGVMEWVSWITKTPSQAMIHFYNCPFVIVNQAAIVHGFMPKFTRIESFQAFYICESCSFEENHTLESGKHYTYATAEKGRELNLPQSVLCSKCKHQMKPDFYIEKHLAFLNWKHGS